MSKSNLQTQNGNNFLSRSQYYEAEEKNKWLKFIENERKVAMCRKMISEVE